MAPKLFDAHSHPRYHRGQEIPPVGAGLTLCAGTAPGDWAEVSAIASGRRDVLPCFGLHPWFAENAGEGWLPGLEGLLRGVPSCVGEIGLDKAADADIGAQESAFREQLRLARALGRPSVIHCVRAWGLLTDILKEERPPSFALHAYSGSPETTAELVRLGGYFSFGAGLLEQGRVKMRKALLSAPADRLLFESEGAPPADIRDVLAAAAYVLGSTPESLGELSWNNARRFLGGLFPEET